MGQQAKLAKRIKDLEDGQAKLVKILEAIRSDLNVAMKRNKSSLWDKIQDTISGS